MPDQFSGFTGLAIVERPRAGGIGGSAPKDVTGAEISILWLI